MKTRRVWAWLVARPQPRQPAPRIVTFSLVAFCGGIVLLAEIIPRRAVKQMLDVIMFATIGIGLIGVAYIAVRSWMIWRRKTH